MRASVQPAYTRFADTTAFAPQSARYSRVRQSAYGDVEPTPDVLIVEDDKAIAQLLCFIVQRAGFLADYVVDGRAARERLTNPMPPSLVILDVMLPYVDGFELLSDIRSNRHWMNVPVLMLTSNRQQRDIDRAFDAGVTDYAVKPFQPEVIKGRIISLIGDKQ